MPAVNLTSLLNDHIADARETIAAGDTFTASITVARLYPMLFRASLEAVRESAALARMPDEAQLYGGDLIDLDAMRAGDGGCVDLDAHEAASDDAEIHDLIAAEQRDAFERDAALSTRNDGTLYHKRLPCEDTDGFSPHISAQARGNVRGPRVLFRLPTLPGEWESV
jgi:hypothetical protein